LIQKFDYQVIKKTLSFSKLKRIKGSEIPKKWAEINKELSKMEERKENNGRDRNPKLTNFLGSWPMFVNSLVEEVNEVGKEGYNLQIFI
jgi:hypothetical protein